MKNYNRKQKYVKEIGLHFLMALACTALVLLANYIETHKHPYKIFGNTFENSK
jgi:hypothetical protein